MGRLSAFRQNHSPPARAKLWHASRLVARSRQALCRTGAYGRNTPIRPIGNLASVSNRPYAGRERSAPSGRLPLEPHRRGANFPRVVAPRRRVRLRPARGAPRPARLYGSIAHGKRAAGRACARRSATFGASRLCRRFCGGSDARVNRGGVADARVPICASARVWQRWSAGPGCCRLFRYAHLRRGRRRRQVPPRRPSMAHRERPKLDRPLSGQPGWQAATRAERLAGGGGRRPQGVWEWHPYGPGRATGAATTRTGRPTPHCAGCFTGAGIACSRPGQ